MGRRPVPNQATATRQPPNQKTTLLPLPLREGERQSEALSFE